MIFNHASKILFNLLLPDFDHFLKIINKKDYALSPLYDPDKNYEVSGSSFEFKTELKIFKFIIQTEHLNVTDETKFKDYLKSIINKQLNLNQLVLKKKFKHFREDKYNGIIEKSNYKILDISIIQEENESFIKLFLPINFVKLFSIKTQNKESIIFHENNIINYFLNPRWAFPDLEIFLQILSEKELSILFNKLQQKNLLSLYQVFLLVKSCTFIWQNTGLSLKIKKSLSKNFINDVVQFGKNEKDLKISKRDLHGGIFSIEESIYSLLKDDNNFFYSIFLKETQKTIKQILNFNLLEMKPFKQWISEMIDKELFYKTISITREDILISAISKDIDHFLPIMKKYISKKKIDAIMKINKGFSYDNWIESQIIIIKNYKKLRYNKTKNDPKSLEYLLLSFQAPVEYNYLFNDVGWFILSTALKGVKKGIISKVTSNLPSPAKFLIEDVLNGSINPNILHDEIQINKAKMICVSSILNLFEDGIINLDL